MQTATNASWSTRSGIDSADIEPDEIWKASLRGRIEDKLRDAVVREAKDSLENELNKGPVSAESREILTSKYFESMQNARKIAAEKYNTALERERQERRWSAGLAMAPEWFVILAQEQEELMDRFKYRNGRGNGSWGSNQTSGMQPQRADSEALKQERQAARPSSSWKPDTFRRERKRLESERRAQTKAMYAIYDQQWLKLTTISELRWDSFPWPTPTMPTTPAEITAATIRGYILSPDFPESTPPRPITARVDEYIQRWHPNHFSEDLFAKVVETDREMVLEGAWAVVIGLKDIQREETRRKQEEPRPAWGGGKDAATQRKENEMQQRELEMHRRETEWKAAEAQLLEENAQMERIMVRLLGEIRLKEEETHQRKRDIEEREDEHGRYSTQPQEVCEAKSGQERWRREGERPMENGAGHSSTPDSSRPPPTSNILNPLPIRPGQAKYTRKAQSPIIITTPPEPSSTSTSTAMPPPLSEESWAQRQTEFAERQREAFHREQERLESERQAHTKRTRTPKGVVNPIFATHQRQWESLSTLDELRWGAFPWPLLKPPSGPHEITLTAINAYIISPDRSSTQTTKDRVKEHLRRWHPDRFETKLLGKVVAEEQDAVNMGAAAVARCLSTLLTQLNSHNLFAS